MIRNRVVRSACIPALTILVSGLVGCGSEPPARVPPPPPAPVAFQPQTVEVELGESGSKATLMTKQEGGFTLDGEDFTGGKVTAENGNEYELALVDGNWISTFAPPDPVVLELGISGSSVTISMNEAREHTLADQIVTDGATALAENGQAYLLRFVEGAWTAEYVVPDPITLALGASGRVAILQQLEDLSWRIVEGEAETAFESGNRVTTDTGVAYRLTLDDGKWSAQFEPSDLEITLGGLDAAVTVAQAESGSYLLGEATLEDGFEYLHEASGNTYAFSRGEGGSWQASYKASQQTVLLGTAGRLTLVRGEDGTWSAGERMFNTGDRVTTDAGVGYRLTFSGGYWSARFDPKEIEIEGTGLIAVSTETGSGYRVGSSSTLPESGVGDVAVDGATYHVWMEDERLRGARFDRAPHGTEAADANFKIGRISEVARLAEDNEDTVANEDGTTLHVAGAEFSIADLLGQKTAAFVGAGIVAEARQDIEAARRDAEILLRALENDRALLRRELTKKWDKAQRAVDTIFGPGTVDLRRELRADRMLQALDSLLAALSSQEAFRAATRQDGGGIFENAALSAATAAMAFAAAEAEASAIFGAAGSTRYGAVKKSVRERGHAVDDLKLGVDGAAVGAFAYSTVEDTLRTRHLPRAGTAYYEGGTTAVSGDGRLYVGDFELQVSLRSDRVSALVSNLKDTEGVPWRYLYRDVKGISLPDAKLSSRANWSRPARLPGLASISFQSKFLRPVFVKSTFAGHLIGTGDSAGGEAVGVWSLGSESSSSLYLAGGFGVERIEAGPDRQPDTDQGAGAATVVVPDDAIPTQPTIEIADGILKLRGTLYGPNLDTDDPDDEIQLLDEQGRRIEDTYQIPLSELFSRQGSERIFDGRNQVDLAREQLQLLRDELETLTRAESTNDLTGRTLVWDDIGRQVQARLFGVEWPLDYPTRNGRARDDKALAAVDEVLAALESENALAAALKQGGDGVFTFDNGDPFRSTATTDIWERVEARIRLWLGSTDYTRFAAWRKQTSANASADYADRLEDGQNGPGSFAYSSLPEAAYSSATDGSFPGGVSARYTGETVAVQGTTFYRGTVEIGIQWHPSWQSDRETGVLSVVFGGLESELGDPLMYFDSSSGEPGSEVGELIFAGIAAAADGEGRLGFSENTASLARIRFADRRKADTGTASAGIEGKFVGYSVDGPLAAIGIWSMRDQGARSRLGNGATLKGAFGAELVP